MFKSVLKTVGVLLPAVGALVASSPVGAAQIGGGAGAVTGSVVLSPGFGLVPSLGQQSFTFNSIAIDGVFAADDTTAPAAVDTCVTTTLNAANVTGAGSVDGSVAADFGGVNAFTASGTCTSGATVTYATSANGGTFVRVGGLVVVAFLGGSCSISAPSPISATCELGVVAEFNPTNPPNDLKDFSFRGAYAAAG